jgi:group I intron endonuclease
MNLSGIYKIQSLCKPERVYIGSAVNIERRWRDHLKGLRSNKHHSYKLQNHFIKYGESDLRFSVILECPKEQLIAREQDFINAICPWFNIAVLANNSFGIKASKELKLRLSIAHKGQVPWNKGIKGVSEATHKKMSDAKKDYIPWMKGKHHTEEEAKKRNLETGLKISEAKRKPILQFDKQSVLIREWDSSMSAANELSVSRSSLCNCLKGESKSCAGYCWKYKK